jgi:hypothetical protein
MYAVLWRALPGPVVVRVVLALVLVHAVVVVCFEWLFPLVASWLPYSETTVTTDTGASALAHPLVPHPARLPHPEDLR